MYVAKQIFKTFTNHTSFYNLIIATYNFQDTHILISRIITNDYNHEKIQGENKMNNKFLLIGVGMLLAILFCGFVSAENIQSDDIVNTTGDYNMVEVDSEQDLCEVDSQDSVSSEGTDYYNDNGKSVVKKMMADNDSYYEVDDGLDNVSGSSIISNSANIYLKSMEVQKPITKEITKNVPVIKSTVTKRVIDHYKTVKYTKTYKAILDGKSIKGIKKALKWRMSHEGGDECCRSSVTKLVRAWWYNDDAYKWKLKKVKRISKKKYSAQAGGKIAKYKIKVRLYCKYKKPVYKTVEVDDWSY